MKRPTDPETWLRSLCTSLPGVAETVAWGHPNFRVAGKTFAVFEIYRGRPSIAVKANPVEQELLIEGFGFYKTPYVGKQGWVSAWVDGEVPWDVLRDLVVKAHLDLSADATTAKRPARHRRIADRSKSPPNSGELTRARSAAAPDQSPPTRPTAARRKRRPPRSPSEG